MNPPEVTEAAHPFWCAEDVELGQGADSAMWHKTQLATTAIVTIDLVMPHDRSQRLHSRPQWRIEICGQEWPLPSSVDTAVVLDLLWAMQEAVPALEVHLDSVPNGDATFDSLDIAAPAIDASTTVSVKKGVDPRPKSSPPDDHPSWCPLDHTGTVDDGYTQALSVVAHDVETVGDAVLDVLMIGRDAPPRRDRRHVHLALDEHTTVGYFGASTEWVDNHVRLLQSVVDAMAAHERGESSEVDPPPDVAVGRCISVIQTDPEL